ncbi:MAG: hypothetical protein ACI8SK_000971 [Shewanella sp.]|jgi:hypothetical protein
MAIIKPSNLTSTKPRKFDGARLQPSYYGGCRSRNIDTPWQSKLELDGSDASVLEIEPILDNLSQYVKTKGMPQERVEAFSKMFGFYIGETYRKIVIFLAKIRNKAANITSSEQGVSSIKEGI